MEIICFRKYFKRKIVDTGNRKPHKEMAISLEAFVELCGTCLTIVCQWHKREDQSPTGSELQLPHGCALSDSLSFPDDTFMFTKKTLFGVGELWGREWIVQMQRIIRLPVVTSVEKGGQEGCETVHL